MKLAAIAAALGLGLAALPSQAAPGGSVVRVEHRDPDTLPTRGPANALVTVEVFFVPGIIPARGATFRSLEKLQAAHPTRIRLVYRVLKNAQVLVPIAALEAHAQGKFHEFLDLLRDTPPSTVLTKDKLLELARRIDMDIGRLTTAISEGRYADVFAENARRQERLHAGTATSALFNSKPTTGSFGGMTDDGFEREYQGAYERATELLDRGVHPAALQRAFDNAAMRTKQPVLFGGRGQDDDEEGASADHPLANPPLVVAGLPSYGRPDRAVTAPVIVLCRPNDPSCAGVLRTLRNVQETYANEVRLYWAPWFDVARDDAADLSLLGDAFACAEQLGTTDDLSASPGWRWVQKHFDMSSRNRRVPAEKLIDQLAKELGVDSRPLAACRARIANRSLTFIEEARRSGVSASPALVIGGRIYERLTDKHAIQQLIEAELAPGVLGEVAPDWRTR